MSYNHSVASPSSPLWHFVHVKDTKLETPWLQDLSEVNIISYKEQTVKTQRMFIFRVPKLLVTDIYIRCSSKIP